MRSGALQFFMAGDELANCLALWSTSTPGATFLEVVDESVVHWSPSGDRPFSGSAIYVVNDLCAPAGYWVDGRPFYEDGNVVVRGPRVVGRILTLAQIGFRSRRHPDGGPYLGLYKSLRAAIRSALRFPILARGADGAEPRSYRDIGYSDGAKAWSLAGGILRQFPKGRVEFLIP